MAGNTNTEFTTFKAGSTYIGLGDAIPVVDNLSLGHWYRRDGQIHQGQPTATTTTNPVVVSQLQLLQQHRRKEGKDDGQQLQLLPTPLQVMALIQKDDPIIHNPAWFVVYLPFICPILVAWKMVRKHFYMYNVDILRNASLDACAAADKHPNKNAAAAAAAAPPAPRQLPPFTLTSQKLDFCLGYMIQVLWIKINRQKHMQLLSDNDMEDKDSDNKASFFFRSNVTRKHFTFFVDFLVQEVWRQRVVTTAAATTGSSSRTKTAVGVGAGAAGASGTGPQANNMTGSSSSLSSRQQRPQQPQQIKGEAEAQEMQRMLATWKPFDYNAWFDSKAEWSKHNNNHNNHNNNNNNTKEEGGVDLESALASMYYTLTHTSQKILGRVKNWDVAFISLSEEEEKWFAAGVDGVATSTDKGEVPPGKLSMSPMALGMQEAKRVQEHWERSGKKQWVDPVYPLEWEGWDMMADDGNDEDEWEKWEVV